MDPDVNQHIQHEKSQDRARQREDTKRRIEAGEKPWETAHGVMSVVHAVRDLEFPRTFDEIKVEAGGREVHPKGDEAYPLSRVLDNVQAHVKPEKDPLIEGEKIPSLRDFQDIVQRHWEGVEYMTVQEDMRPEGGGFQPQHKGD